MKNPYSNSDIFNYLGNNLEVYTVSSLRFKFSNLLKQSFLNPIVIKAVISSKPKIYPDFVFFDIRDEHKNIYISVLANIYTYRKAENKLKNLNVVAGFIEDLPLMLVVEPKISSQKKLEIRLALVDIIPEYTSSVLKNKFDETINRLKEEGLFDLQKKLNFPILPRNIVILSSDQGTSFKDITVAFANSTRFFNIIFISVRVEGTEAINKISSAISNLNNLKNIDLILLARGGGSLQDLSVFNDYYLCKAICISKIPIICAIGHETDTLASEIVAYLNPKPSTPSGIGVFINNYFNKLIDEFINLNSQISNLINQDLLNEYFKIKDQLIISKNAILNQYTYKISNFKNICLNINSYFKINKKIFFKFNLDKIKSLLNNFILNFKKELKISDDKIQGTLKIIEANNHKTILARGYAFISSLDGTTIKSIKKAEKIMKLNFKDGSIKIQSLEDDLNE